MFFCFLWDDSLFNPRQLFTDAEDKNLCREARLTALETLYIRISALEQAVQSWRECAGRHAWVVRQLLDRVKIPAEVLKKINIEQQVNVMDPDFAFADWLKNYADSKEQG